jgi:phytoene dehydrogenase-like protein
MRVIVVGAGVAGLVCARELRRAGIEDVQLLEASDGPGGRVRSDHAEGFTLDRGFQVLFTAYPAAARQLDYPRLALRRFDPGAVICHAARRQALSDPTRDPAALASSLMTGVVPFDDKIRTAILTAELRMQSIRQILDAPEETTEAYLCGRGFSADFLEYFARPFFGSIFLTDSLQTSARAFRFDWKMLSEGDTVVPAHGMGALSDQLAEELIAAECLRLNAPVTELLLSPDSSRCLGVRTSAGESIDADHVVVATAAPEAARLTGLPMPQGAVGTTQVYFTGDAPVHNGRKILLHANRDCVVRSAIQISNVAPEYAPAGRCLLSASILGIPDGDDATIYALALADLRRMFAGDSPALAALESYRPLRLYRIPYAQYPQPPGVFGSLPKNRTTLPGLFLAGELTAASSLNAAMHSGEKAATFILADAA